MTILTSGVPAPLDAQSVRLFGMKFLEGEKKVGIVANVIRSAVIIG